MAVIRSQALSVVREPGANVLVLRGREDDVAVSVVSAEVSIPEAMRHVLGGLVLNLGQSPLLLVG